MLKGFPVVLVGDCTSNTLDKPSILPALAQFRDSFGSPPLALVELSCVEHKQKQYTQLQQLCVCVCVHACMCVCCVCVCVCLCTHFLFRCTSTAQSTKLPTCKHVVLIFSKTPPLHVVIKECMHLVLLYSTVCDDEWMNECIVVCACWPWLSHKVGWGAVLIALSECSVLGWPVDRTWTPEVIAASY